MKILSILIATIPERAEMFTQLYNNVMRQVAYMQTFHGSLGEIEVIVDDSPKFLNGGISIGKKRERLVKSAEGKYLCFLDDDESIAPNYVEKIVRLCNEDKDICTFNSLAKVPGFWMIVQMRLNNPNNEDAHPGFISRKAWHICPVRSIFAKLHDFEDISYGEDWKWFDQVLEHCQTEAHTDHILHQYNHGEHSEADKITAHVQPIE
jgi:hypothetical protein